MKTSTKVIIILAMSLTTCLVWAVFINALSTQGTVAVHGTPTPKPTSTPTPVVSNDWDGSVRQVRWYLIDNLKDPKSCEYLEWSPVVRISTGYAVRVKYRAKNSFGGYVIEEKIFALDFNGNVIVVTDY